MELARFFPIIEPFLENRATRPHGDALAVGVSVGLFMFFDPSSELVRTLAFSGDRFHIHHQIPS